MESTEQTVGTAARPESTLALSEVLAYLERCGVPVRHAAAIPTSATGRSSIVVFLEGTPEQCDFARTCALRIPSVFEVTFSGHTPTIMYLYGRRPMPPRPLAEHP